MIHQMLADPGVVQALLAGVIVAALCGFVGVFVVMRRQSFAGHAITDVGFTGGAGAPLAGLDPLAGLLAFSVIGSIVMARLGDKIRERDVATGVVLTASLGLGALFLFIQTRYVSQPAALLFGSIFAIRSGVLLTTMVVGAACVIALAILYRPLIFSTVNPETAAARGVPVKFISTAFLLIMGVAVAEAAQLVGVLLTTALLIGPASAAITFSRRVPWAILFAVIFGAVQMTLSIFLAYASYTWPPGGKGWPVSFFLGVLALGTFVIARFFSAGDSRRSESNEA
ncbi:MAG: metal ABC transporter permease [Candidatus Eremiobacteraeota bacterium]|nr:metal ABC transporter permease [Candidatus Eremiobacteraeota bacterium]